MDNADDHHEEDQTDGSEGHRGVEESDSSEDEVCCITGFLGNKFRLVCY